MVTASLTKVRRCEGTDETGVLLFLLRCSWVAAVSPSGRTADDVVESPCRASELMLKPPAIRPPKAAMVGSVGSGGEVRAEEDE